MKTTAAKNVREYYNEHVIDEDKRLDRNVFEIPVTMKYIERYLKPGDRILDIACGTGKYAELLLKKGYRLGLNDLSDKNMEITLQRNGDDPNILHKEVSNALYAKIWGEEAWDGILILGPMYHLTEKADRLQILRRAVRSVKKGGVIFTAYMSRSGAMKYGLKNNPEGILKEFGASQLWHNGTDDEFIEGTKWFINAYFSFPEEIFPLLEQAGLEPLHLVGIEGIFGEQMELYDQLDDSLKEPWMNFIMEHSEDIHMVHNSKHMLAVSRVKD